MIRNRYCLVGYGGFFEREHGHFILVDGQPCYFATNFSRARNQLRNEGLNEDGYEAIQFAIDNIPFRNTPFISKNIILITDEGRTTIPLGKNITRETIQDELKVHTHNIIYIYIYIVQPK